MSALATCTWPCPGNACSFRTCGTRATREGGARPWIRRGTQSSSLLRLNNKRAHSGACDQSVAFLGVNCDMRICVGHRLMVMVNVCTARPHDHS